MSDLSASGPNDKWSDEWWATSRGRRCEAHKKNGDRCHNPARRGTNVCDYHGAKAPQVKAKARQRLEEAADRMAKELLNIATDSESEHVKLAAIRDALDRAGISAKQALELSAAGAAKPYEELLQGLSGIATISREESRARRGLAPEPRALAAPEEPIEVVDAELVEPEEYPADPPHRRAHGPVPADRGDGPPPRPHFAEDAPSAQPGTGLQTLEDAVADLRDRRQR